MTGWQPEMPDVTSGLPPVKIEPAKQEAPQTIINSRSVSIPWPFLVEPDGPETNA
jgi:hypothetical protein